MNNDIIARYIYAVTRYLPEKTRADVEKELDGLISDMLEERCAGRTPAEADIKAVLTELGTPEELAAKYSGDENKALISGSHLLLYKRILKLVLPIAAAGIAFAGLLAVFVEWNPNPDTFQIFGETFGRIIGGAISGAFQAFAIITIIFAVLEYKKVAINKEDMFSNLPPVPKNKERIKIHEPIIDIMWSIICAILLIGFPQVLGIWQVGIGWTPVFNLGILHGFWLIILFLTLLSVIKNAMKLVEGQYTARLAIVTAAANILIMAAMAIVFLNSNIINPEFISLFDRLVPVEDIKFVFWPFHNFNLFIVGVGFFGLVVETAVTAVKAIRHRS
ncbi:MAG TPA: hypothetical protein PK854_02575 [Oscillospiraceae bacterium]|nr:hypothetical protein [Oscillospiraceae bacterium]HPS34130.1 hypothetical protein [Oscillospiraceae bacterium]